jgi:hypothetical protein
MSLAAGRRFDPAVTQLSPFAALVDAGGADAKPVAARFFRIE